MSTLSSSLPVNMIGQHQLRLNRCQRSVFYESPLNASLYDEAYSLVCDAAARGDNVGHDEYPTFEHFRSRLIDGASFTAGLQLTGNRGPLAGLISVVPSRYSRSPEPTVCQLVIVASPSLADDENSRRDLVEIGTEAARRCPRRPAFGMTTIDRGPEASDEDVYSACAVNVFVLCVDHLLPYRSVGFTVTACIPNSGRLANRRKPVDNYILYKEFIVDINNSKVSLVSTTLLAVMGGQI